MLMTSTVMTHDARPSPCSTTARIQSNMHVHSSYTITNCHVCRYLGSPSILCHSVPCDNKECCWTEVTRRWKQLLQLIMGSLEEGGIRCYSVVNVPKSSNINIIPERSNQWKASRWKHFREVLKILRSE